VSHAPASLGFEGTAVPEDVAELALGKGLGGIVLFARNCPSLDVVLALTAAARACGPDVLVLVDHEGGPDQPQDRPVKDRDEEDEGAEAEDGARDEASPAEHQRADSVTYWSSRRAIRASSRGAGYAAGAAASQKLGA